MKQAVREAIERHVRRFADGVRCDVLDAVIDTTGPGTSAVPVLALWAFDVTAGDDFDAALAKARAHDDPGFLEDVLSEVRCDAPGLSLRDVFPNWPDDSDDGMRELASVLTALARSHPPELAGVRRFVLRWVGSLDLQSLR